MPTRREFLVGGLAFVAAACTGGNGKDGGDEGTTISSLVEGSPELSLLGLGAGALGGSPSDPVQTGLSYVTFDLSTSNQIIGGGTPLVYVARNENGPAAGPFRAVWGAFTGYDLTGDRSPKSPIPGVYTAPVRFPSPGLWTVAAVGPNGRSQGVGVTHVYAADDVVGAVGTKALAVKTPVATGEEGLRQICTRNPPDPMHYISLDEALKNGKPTIAVFSTPLLCESRLCGPVTDEVLLVYRKLGKAKANFVHVEEFLPGPDHEPDASKLSPGFRTWGFRTEPWVFVINRQGVIAARFEGSVTAPVIQSVLQPLL